MSSSNRTIPALPGSYLLACYLRRRATIAVGRLGTFRFNRGWYCYSGSAFGPGGLRGRLSHHLKPVRRPHWHIDYLRSAAELRAVWYQLGVNNEHLWAEQLALSAAARIPAARFGASDCACPSHLLYFPRRLKDAELSDLLGVDRRAGGQWATTEYGVLYRYPF